MPDESEEVSRVPSDLHAYRGRLDAGVELGRRNRETVQGLTDQIQRIRKKAAEDASSLAGSLPHINIELPGASWSDPRQRRDASDHSPQRGRNKSLSRLDQVEQYAKPCSGATSMSRHRSSPRLESPPDFDKDEVDALFGRLKSELFKNSTLEEMNEMLREENDAALQANEGLRSDVTGLTKALESLESQTSSDQQRFHSENNRYRGQLEAQHRQLIALWKAFTAVKRQVRDLHTTTANDMDKQMTEFTRCASMMQRAIRQAENKNIRIQDKNTRENEEMLENLTKRLEKMSADCVQAEKLVHEKTRQLTKVEGDLRRAKEETEEVREIVSRIERMPELGKQSKRTRSASPGVSSSDVVRKIRSALSAKNNEVKDLEEQVERLEAEKQRLRRETETYERERREKRDAEKQRDNRLEEKDHKLKEMEGDLRRLNERLQLLMEEKESREKVLLGMQDSIAAAHRSHKEFIEQLTVRHREELYSREELHRTEVEGHTQEASQQFEKAQLECDRTKTEVEELRQQLRELNADAAATRKAVDEKDFTLLSLGEDISSLRQRLSEEEAKADERETEVEKANARLDEARQREQALRNQIVELQNLNSIVNDESKNLHEQISTMRTEVAELQEKVDTATSNEEDFHMRLSSHENALAEKDDAIRALKGGLQDIEIKLETTLEERRICREELENCRQLQIEKVKELTETVRLLEETSRERDMIGEDYTGLKQENDSLSAQIAAFEKQLAKKREEEDELRSLVEDLRSNFDRLTSEGQQKTATIDDLKEQIEVLNSEMKKNEEIAKAERARLEETARLREKELEDEWQERLDTKEKEMKSIRSELATTEGGLKDLTALHEKLMEEEMQLRMQLEDAKDALEESAAKYKKEIEQLSSQNEMDREDWEAERDKLEKAKAALVAELRFDLSKAEEDIKEGLVREDELREQLEQLKGDVESAEERRATAERHRDEQGESLRDVEKEWQEEKRSLTSTVEELQLKLTRAAANHEENDRRRQAIEKELTKTETAMSKKSATIEEFERKVDSLMGRLNGGEKSELQLRDRMAVLERENHEAKAARERSANKLAEETKRAIELEQKVRELSKGMQSVRVRAQLEEEGRMGRGEEVQVLTNKLRHLEIQLADRQAKYDTSAELLRKMEADGSAMAQELRREREKCSELSRANEELRLLSRQAGEELETLRSALEKKTASSKQATAELILNYREVDKKYVDMQTECEHLKAHIVTINAKLDRAESKKRDLERRCEDGYSRQAELVRRLNQYERSAKMALNMARSQTILRPGTSTVDIPRTTSSGLGDSHSFLRAATSSHDVSRNSPDRSVHFDDEPSRSLDMSTSMDITLRYLKERISQLERDKADLTMESETLRVESKTASEKLKEAAALLQGMERRAHELQEDNRQLEHRLSSQRQLYLSNEESSRGRDTESKALRAKIASAELHLREKDSKLAQISSQLESARVELASANCDREKQTSMARERAEEARRLEEEQEQTEGERRRLQKTVKDLQNEIKVVSKRFEESEAEKNRLERNLADVKKTATRDRETLEKLQGEERHWRQAAVSAKKSSDEQHRSVYEERLISLQASHDAAVARNEAAAQDGERLRQELRDYNLRVNALNLKLADMERRASGEKEAKTTLALQLAAFQKVEAEWTKLEREMAEELKNLRKDKLTLTSELEELRRRVVRCDVERKEVDGCRARLDREVAALKKHLAALEEDKARTDAAVRETMSERRAIDKSLAAMERENSELYRNCGQLQAQIQQLERDSGQRAVSQLMKDQTTLEGRIAKLNQEKRQLELIIEQKDSNFSHKRKMLESQLSLLRDQLEAERRRRSSGRFERSTDVRISRTSAVQRQKSPFRYFECRDDVVSRISSFTNDTSTSVETIFH